MKLDYIHWYRGFAMSHIVLWHSFYPEMVYDSFFEKSLKSLMINGTTFFVFISGFLFSYLSERYEYKDFLIKKIKYVVLPYFIVSIPALIWRFTQFFSGELPLDYVPSGIIDNGILFFLWTLAVGFHLGPLWFVPYASLIFLFSPFFYRLSIGKFILLFLYLSLTVTVFTFRPLHNIQPVFSLIHFCGFYILGVFVSRVKDNSIWISNVFVFVLGVTVLFCTIINAYYLQSDLNFENTILNGELMVNVNAIQKIAFCLFMFSFLKKSRDIIPNAVKNYLNLVAEYSFGIFFVHYYFILMLQRVVNKIYPNPSDLQCVYISIVQFVICMSCSIFVVYFGKSLFKNNSRIVVGA